VVSSSAKGASATSSSSLSDASLWSELREASLTSSCPPARMATSYSGLTPLRRSFIIFSSFMMLSRISVRTPSPRSLAESLLSSRFWYCYSRRARISENTDGLISSFESNISICVRMGSILIPLHSLKQEFRQRRHLYLLRKNCGAHSLK